MDTETVQNRENGSREYTLSAVRNGDAISVSFGDVGHNLSVKSVDVASLTENPVMIDETLRGVEILKDESGKVFLNITGDFSLPYQTERFVLNSPQVNAQFFCSSFYCDSMKICCEEFHPLDRINAENGSIFASGRVDEFRRGTIIQTRELELHAKEIHIQSVVLSGEANSHSGV
jgi:hypothetical protein